MVRDCFVKENRLFCKKNQYLFFLNLTGFCRYSEPFAMLKGKLRGGFGLLDR